MKRKKNINSKIVYACLTCGRDGEQLVSTGVTKSGRHRTPRFKCEDGHTVQKFDSEGEYAHYKKRKLEERAGVIRNLETQPSFDLMVNGKNLGTWRGDLSYFEGNERIVEDYKGYFNIKGTDKGTRLWKLQTAIVEADYGVKVRVVTK